jgi:hypothetical protein
MNDILGSQKNVDNYYNTLKIPPDYDNLYANYVILTPGGYLLERIQSTRKQANIWAKNHYSVYRIELDN